MKSLWILVMLNVGASPVLAESSFERAEKVAGIIGIGRSGACSSCHALNSEQTLTRWAKNFTRVSRECIDNSELSPNERLYCLSQQKPEETLNLRPESLGFWSAGLHLASMSQLMQDAIGADATQALQKSLRESTIMPLRTATLLSETEFAQLRDWLDDGMPHLSELLAPYQGPEQCEAFLAPELQTHLRLMQESGWKKRNADRGLFMFACNPQQSSCFYQKKDGQDIFPDVSQSTEFSAWKANAATQLRLVDEFTDETHYWIRSSADGRFVGFGGNPSGIIDLQSRLTGADVTRKIEVDAFYDPSFFPDDSAFVFQGFNTGICSTSLLKNPSTKAIDFTEDACTSNDELNIPLYQAVGASLDGADYLAVSGDFSSDGGNGFWLDRQVPDAASLASPRAQLMLQPLEYDGLRWLQREAQVFDSPWEKDWGLAPSNRLLISRLEGRVDGAIKHIGYQLYQLNKQATANQGPVYSKNLVGRLCFDGLKGSFSFDDRFFVSYGYIKPEHYRMLGYESAEDPEFKARLEAGTANVYLYDLANNSLQTLTHMGPGQFALFPHFRSDGWIYFMVYDQNSGRRYLMSSDQAIQAQAQSPLRP